MGLPASSAVLSPAERLLQQDVKLMPPGSKNDVVQEFQPDTLPQRTVSPAQLFVRIAGKNLHFPRCLQTFHQHGMGVKSKFCQKVQETLADVSGWDMDKSHRWNQDAHRLLLDISQGKFDMVWITLPTQGMPRTLFANANGPSPQRSRRYPYGFPWLPQQGKRATNAVTIHAATLLVLAFAAMTQKGTALVLTTSEERGEAHFGEPCSWWQTAEVRYLAKLAATRGRSTRVNWHTSGLKEPSTSQVPWGSWQISRVQRQ